VLFIPAMARTLTFRHRGVDIAVEPQKVDRERLYGFIRSEVLDDNGKTCELFTLAGDGKTLIARGGTCLAVLSAEGEWLEKDTLEPVDLDGRPITPVPSSYAAPVDLVKTVTIDEYLAHDTRLVYRIELGAEAAELLRDLRNGTIYTFPFSFRGGVEYDAAFLLCNHEGEPFMLVGRPTEIHFVGLSQTIGAQDTDESEAVGEEDESIDFGMM
jgi:hypothetical protein